MDKLKPRDGHQQPDQSEQAREFDGYNVKPRLYGVYSSQEDHLSNRPLQQSIDNYRGELNYPQDLSESEDSYGRRSESMRYDYPPDSHPRQEGPPHFPHDSHTRREGPPHFHPDSHMRRGGAPHLPPDTHMRQEGPPRFPLDAHMRREGPPHSEAYYSQQEPYDDDYSPPTETYRDIPYGPRGRGRHPVGHMGRYEEEDYAGTVDRAPSREERYPPADVDYRRRVVPPQAGQDFGYGSLHASGGAERRGK